MGFLEDASLTGATSLVKNGLTIDDAVTILLTDSGVVYDGWKSISIQRSLSQLSGSFSISLVDKWRQIGFPWFLKPGIRCVIRIGKLNVLNGFIDRLDVEIKKDDRRIEITGRDLTGDLVDSSATTEPSEFKNVTILQLAQKFLSPFEISVSADVDITPVFTKFTVKQGESIFELLQRAAQNRGLLLVPNELGQVLITNRSSLLSQTRSLTPLVQGKNVIEAKAAYDDSERFQTYIVKGQSEGTETVNGLNSTAAIGTATDLSILRSRTKTIIADGSVDVAAAQKRASWENINRAAKSVDAVVKVQGWRQLPNGPLWSVNQLVPVDIGFIGIQAKELLINSVQFTKNLGEGTVTTLNLTRQDAYVPNQAVITPVEDPHTDLGWKKQVFKILGT